MARTGCARAVVAATRRPVRAPRRERGSRIRSPLARRDSIATTWFLAIPRKRKETFDGIPPRAPRRARSVAREGVDLEVGLRRRSGGEVRAGGRARDRGEGAERRRRRRGAARR